MRRIVPLTLVAVVATAACSVPLVNAPPGGGEIVTGTYRIGPFNLAANGNPGWQAEGIAFSAPRPSGSFGIKAMRFDLVDESGTSVPRHDAHLHHVVLAEAGLADPLCGSTRFGLGEPLTPFAGSGMERTPIRFRDPYAYLVDVGDTWRGIYHVMNMSSSAQTVYIEYELDYQPAANDANTRRLTSYFMDVDGCGNAEYDIPGNGGPGSLHLNSRTWTAPEGGIVVFAAGHLHQGGVDLRLYREPSGSYSRQLACRSNAIYADSGMLDAMTTCVLHHPVDAGREYTVESRYDNSQPWAAVMGIMLVYVWHGTQ